MHEAKRTNTVVVLRTMAWFLFFCVVGVCLGDVIVFAYFKDTASALEAIRNPRALVPANATRVPRGYPVKWLNDVTTVWFFYGTMETKFFIQGLQSSSNVAFVEESNHFDLSDHWFV